MKPHALALFAAFLLAAPVAANDVVNLFPSQPWDSLVSINAAADSPEASAPELDTALPDGASAQETVKAPQATERNFQAIGEWRDAGQRIVVLDLQGQTYLLCERCQVASALRPGGKFAQQYTFKALEPLRAVLLDPQGRELSVDLAALAD